MAQPGSSIQTFAIIPLLLISWYFARQPREVFRLTYRDNNTPRRTFSCVTLFIREENQSEIHPPKTFPQVPLVRIVSHIPALSQRYPTLFTVTEINKQCFYDRERAWVELLLARWDHLRFQQLSLTQMFWRLKGSIPLSSVIYLKYSSVRWQRRLGCCPRLQGRLRMNASIYKL